MDSINPYIHCSGFMDLLTSQQETNPYDDDPVFSTQCTDDPSLNQDKPNKRRERRKWSHTEDVVLISAWLNTSKNAVVRNKQKGNAFWSRIAAYYAASPKLAGLKKREPTHCKQRWQKINNQVCKFVGSYEAATKEKSSGQNEDDVMKLAYDIFFNDYKVKFTLEHAWRELRYDNRPSKRRKCDEHSAQSSSYVPVSHEEYQAHPPGVKASKAKGKRSVSKATTVEKEGNALLEFQSMWEIKQKDLAMKERLSKNKLLDSLLVKTEPLSDMEIALKNKLINDMLSNS